MIELHAPGTVDLAGEDGERLLSVLSQPKGLTRAQYRPRPSSAIVGPRSTALANRRPVARQVRR